MAGKVFAILNVFKSLKFLWILKALNSAVRAVYDQHNIFTFLGEERTGIALDGVVELVSTHIHIAIYHNRL